MRSALLRLATARLGAAEAEASCCRWAAAFAAATTTSLSPPSIAHRCPSSPSSTSTPSSFSTSTSSSASSPPRNHRRTTNSPSSSSSRPVPPSKFMHDVFARARARPQRILLNEPGDPRVLAAAAALAERGLCVPVLLGSRPAIAAFAGELAQTLLQREKEEKGTSNNGRSSSGRRKKSDSEEEDGVEALPADQRFLRGLDKCEIIDPFRAEEVGELTARYADELARARAHKGMTVAAARELLRPEGHGRGSRVPNASIHFATMMLRSGDAGGLLSGAAHTTLETVRPSLQLLTRRPHRGGGEEDGEAGKKSGGAGEAAVAAAPPGLVSSLFFMCLPRGVVAFADCALNVAPSPSELARIALDSASTARAFGLVPPRVALLSYSTRGSGRGPGPDAAAAAAEAARRAAPPGGEGVFVDGPLQYDAAVSPSVGKRKRKKERKTARKTGTDVCFPLPLFFPSLHFFYRESPTVFLFFLSSPKISSRTTTTTTTTKHHDDHQQPP